MVSQALAELRLRNSSNLVMADTFTEVHRKDGLVCAVGDAAAVSVECAGVDGADGGRDRTRAQRSAAPSETGTASCASASTTSCACGGYRRLATRPIDESYDL